MKDNSDPEELMVGMFKVNFNYDKNLSVCRKLLMAHWFPYVGWKKTWSW